MDIIMKVGELLQIALPNLPVIPKSIISAVLVLLCALMLVFMWATPSTLSSIDRRTSERFEIGVKNFFDARENFSPDAALVFGQAKSIVQRFESEPDVFNTIMQDIERMKQEDNNWKFANEWSYALALVGALGLSPDTKRENAVFLQTPLPRLPKSPQ